MNRSNIIPFRRRRRRSAAFLFVPGLLLASLAVLALPYVETSPLRDGSPKGGAKPTILNGGGAWNGIQKSDARMTYSRVAGKVTHVRDGDTLEVAGIPIRIANLNCAESGTIAGDRATRRMRQLVNSSSMECKLSGRRSYDREVGTCRFSGGRDVGEVLIAEGICARWR